MMASGTGPDTLTVEGRVIWVLEHVYHGNQRMMSKDLGISQAAVSRLARGEQKAGRNVIAAVTANPLINEDWLLSGRGTPLTSQDRNALSGGRMLPVATEVLPGLPSQAPHLLSGLYYPVADAYAGEERYWLQIQGDAPITRVDEWKIKVRDFLLLEADRRVWCDDVRFLNRKLCAIRLAGKSLKYGLSEVRWDHESGGLVHVQFGQEDGPSARAEEAEPVPRLIRRRIRIVDVGDGPTPEEPKDVTASGSAGVSASSPGAAVQSAIMTGSKAFPSPPRQPHAPQPLAVDDVLAVCMLIVRTA
jgi:hypothetical protein